MTSPLRNLWHAIESLPDLAAVPSEWQSLLGAEHDLVRRFLLPTQRLARSVKSTIPGRACVHEIRRHKGEYLAVCPDGCDTVTLAKTEIVIHKLDVPALCREIAEALVIEAATPETLPHAARAMHIGEYVPYSGLRFPACLAVTGEPEDMRRVVDALLAKGGAFILLAPTRPALTQSCADSLRQTKSCFLALAEVLGLDARGRLALSDGHTAEALLADFRAANTPKPEEQDGMVFFPTPAGAQWGDVTIRFIDGETASVNVKGQSNVLLYSQMGMIDGRNKKPTKQWQLLRDFAAEHGIIDWRSRKADRHKQKQREELAKDLRRFFRIDCDPFVQEGNGWRALFTVTNGE